MNKNTKIIISLLVLGVSYIIGVSIGLYFYTSKLSQGEFFTQILNSENKTETILKENIQEVSTSNNKVTENTKIVYEYFYKDNGFTEVLEDLPPYYAIGLDRSDFEKAFPEWNLKSFSIQKIVLQKVLEGEKYESYFLSEYNGNVAVFSENELNEENLLQITNKPVISLPKEEQEKIKNGIYIEGKTELINYIQDYES